MPVQALHSSPRQTSGSPSAGPPTAPAKAPAPRSPGPLKSFDDLRIAMGMVPPVRKTAQRNAKLRAQEQARLLLYDGAGHPPERGSRGRALMKQVTVVCQRSTGGESELRAQTVRSILKTANAAVAKWDSKRREALHDAIREARGTPAGPGPASASPKPADGPTHPLEPAAEASAADDSTDWFNKDVEWTNPFDEFGPSTPFNE